MSSIPRIYFPHPLKSATRIILDDPSSRHLLTVLRLHIGEPLQIFNGEGGAYSATLQACEKKRAVIALGEFISIDTESPLAIHLGQAISRGERMDYTVQKSVELGVAEITPLFTERCGVQLNAERQENRVQHWQKIAISAAEQSGRCRVPIIHQPQSLTNFLAQTSGVGFICSPAESQTFPELPATLQALTLLIGPEGGFSPPEIRQAHQSGFHSLSLGPRILRTETAAVVALSLLQTHWGDLLT